MLPCKYYYCISSCQLFSHDTAGKHCLSIKDNLLWCMFCKLPEFNSIQFDLITFNSIQFSSIQFSSIQFNSIHSTYLMASLTIPSGLISFKCWRPYLASTTVTIPTRTWTNVQTQPNGQTQNQSKKYIQFCDQFN